MALPITIVTLQTKRAWRTCLFATAVFSHVSLLEYFCSYVQDHHPKGAQTTWSVVLVTQTRYFLLFDNRRAVYKRSTKCSGDKSIATFTDSLNFIRLLRVVITPSVAERRKWFEAIGCFRLVDNFLLLKKILRPTECTFSFRNSPHIQVQMWGNSKSGRSLTPISARLEGEDL